MMRFLKNFDIKENPIRAFIFLFSSGFIFFTLLGGLMCTQPIFGESDLAHLIAKLDSIISLPFWIFVILGWLTWSFRKKTSFDSSKSLRVFIYTMVFMGGLMPASIPVVVFCAG